MTVVPFALSLNLHILTQSTMQDLKPQSVGTLMPRQDVMLLPKFSVLVEVSLGFLCSLVSSQYVWSLMWSLAPSEIQGAFELTDPRMVSFYRELPGSFSQMFWK